MMKRSDIPKLPVYFDHYIEQVEDCELLEALEKYDASFFEKEKQLLLQLGDKTYAPGKWTVKDILQHITDTERIFAYRALRFGRNDATELPGFDDPLYAKNAGANSRTIDDLLEEFSSVRNATIHLYKHLSEEALLREGSAGGKNISVLALGFTIVGHGIHHMRFLKEKYYPLIK